MSTRMLGSLLLLVGLVFSFNAQTTTQTTQTIAPDLSGTYTGTFDCDIVGLTGETTLTITGNQFTTAEGKTGRIVMSTTGGYMAVALQVGEATAGSTPQIISLRAKKSGNRLTLMSVPGSMQKCTFTPARMARGRRTPRTPAATGTDVANPATAPVPTTTPETPMPSQTPSPSPTPSPEPEPSPMPSPTPEPDPSPMPSPTPGESPTPMPSPTASPSPTGSPTPSPTPSPSPARPRG